RQQRQIEVAEWSWSRARRNGGAFEYILEIAIVVVTETAHSDALPIALQLSSDIAVLATVVRFHGESAVGPQLPLGTESVRRLHQGQQERSANRTDGWNLAQSLYCRIATALFDQ